MILFDGYRSLAALKKDGPEPCRFFHRWGYVSFTGRFLYEACRKCGSRRIRQVSAYGYQPVDRRWLETGEFESFATARLPKGGTAATRLEER